MLFNQNKKEEMLGKGKLDPLYLMGKDKKMHHVVYSQTHDVNLEDTGFALLWTPEGNFPQNFL